MGDIVADRLRKTGRRGEGEGLGERTRGQRWARIQQLAQECLVIWKGLKGAECLRLVGEAWLFDVGHLAGHLTASGGCCGWGGLDHLDGGWWGQVTCLGRHTSG